MSTAVLVTGGAGYIGSHTCKALHKHGFLPVTLDNLTYGHREFVKWGPLFVGDTHDSATIGRVIAETGAVAVIHFAAFAYVGESVSDPSKYYFNNVGGTLGLLDGMRLAGCNKIIFSSTCAVYGEPGTLSITEQTTTAPINPYGRSKLVCEDMLRDFDTAYGMRSVILRYFNASGDDADGDVGERREVETHLIPRAMMALQGYLDDFAIFGSDFPTPDGTAIRDYIHVSDLAEAHVLALRQLLKGGRSSLYNLGAGTGHSVGEVLRVIAEVSGMSLPAPRGARRPGDPARLTADASLARRELGFDPVSSDLRTIIETAWRWHLVAHPRRNAATAARL